MMRGENDQFNHSPPHPRQPSILEELLAKGCLKLLAGEVQLALGSFSLGIRRNGSESGFVPDELRCWQLASYLQSWISP